MAKEGSTGLLARATDTVALKENELETQKGELHQLAIQKEPNYLECRPGHAL